METVFFGNASAPHVAISSVEQNARDFKRAYPIAAIKAQSDFYIDNMLSGAKTRPEAIKLQQESRELFNAGGFNLRQWVSNDPDSLIGIPEDLREFRDDISINTTIKMLGVQWSPKQDMFSYKIDLGGNKQEYSKRDIVSEIAKLFDPLGWITPTIVLAKMYLQEVWLEKIEWDKKVPAHINDKWRNYKEDLQEINQFKIQRYIQTGHKDARYELHGFCDASTKAYAAVVYLKVIQKEEIKVNIIIAKSKVAPIKTISLPRLELCGALLLAKLLVKTKAALKLDCSVHEATDSEITLAWINGDSHRWETFLANRVTKIQQLVNPIHWYHVGTKDNPADVASRGMIAADLKNCSIWWKGPEWLAKRRVELQRPNLFTTTFGERKIHSMITINTSDFADTITKF